MLNLCERTAETESSISCEDRVSTEGEQDHLGVWVSGDREQSFPSASLVNYIVRDPISVLTVH